jgi:hypothetical protein
VGALMGATTPFLAAAAAALACLVLYTVAGAVLWPSVLGSLPGVARLRARLLPGTS